MWCRVVPEEQRPILVLGCIGARCVPLGAVHDNDRPGLGLKWLQHLLGILCDILPSFPFVRPWNIQRCTILELSSTGRTRQ